ncbi:hypothetical protein BT69DRAFT_680943 [Atractiella rhizophila]|nr:hypothetical protein BT69DRAFT_680943 [Atractiella rhizophila]
MYGGLLNKFVERGTILSSEPRVRIVWYGVPEFLEQLWRLFIFLFSWCAYLLVSLLVTLPLIGFRRRLVPQSSPTFFQQQIAHLLQPCLSLSDQYMKSRSLDALSQRTKSTETNLPPSHDEPTQAH